MYILSAMNMNPAQARQHAAMLKTLAHPLRVRLVDALNGSDRSVNELAAALKESQPNVSRHLAQLKAAGIVTERREGVRVIHHLSCPCMLQAFSCALEATRIAERRRKQEAGT
jgi:DNA-binding transcriptional ArsR family regulator